MTLMPIRIWALGPNWIPQNWLIWWELPMLFELFSTWGFLLKFYCFSFISLMFESVNANWLLWCLIALFTTSYWFQLVVFFCKQANEVVKANNLSDVVIVLHGRVEVGSSEQYMFFIHWNILWLKCWHEVWSL